jgi:hypothetical protein
MTSRERWTVYPLLLLAIGLAMRAVAVPADPLIAGTVEASRLVCREIVIQSADGTLLVHMGQVVGAGGGRIEIKDDTGTDAIAVGTGADDRAGRIEYFDELGAMQGSLTAKEYARQDSNLQPSVPKTDALSN